jgi:hypothetical protein
MVTSINRYLPVLSMTLLGFAALLSSAMPASAASQGRMASCSFSSPTRLQCNIPVIALEPYPSASGGTKRCSRGGRFVVEQITN